MAKNSKSMEDQKIEFGLWDFCEKMCKIGARFHLLSHSYQKMGGNKLALRDIDLALSYGYPEDKAFKLFERKGECESARGEKSKALDSFQMAIKMIKKNAGLQKNQQKQQQKFIAAIEKKIEKVKEEMEQGCNNTTNDNISEATVEAASNYLNGIDLNPDRYNATVL